MAHAGWTRRLRLTFVAAAPLVVGCPLLPQTFNPVPSDPALSQGSYRHPAGGKTLTLFGGAGSGAFRGPTDRALDAVDHLRPGGELPL